MSLDQYLRLLDWTDRVLRTDKAGSISAECEPNLERRECSPEMWLDIVKHFRSEAGLARNRKAFRTVRR